MLFTHSYSKNWERLLLYSHLFAAGALVRAGAENSHTIAAALDGNTACAQPEILVC